MTIKQPIVTEQTAKKWKMLQLLGVVGILLGSAVAAFGFTSDSPSGVVIGVIILVLASPLYAFGRFLAWWHHG